MAERPSMVASWCVRCQRTRTLADASIVIYRGKEAEQGRCPVCGTLVRKSRGKEALHGS